jgi:hypothetical protein
MTDMDAIMFMAKWRFQDEFVLGGHLSDDGIKWRWEFWQLRVLQNEETGSKSSMGSLYSTDC